MKKINLIYLVLFISCCNFISSDLSIEKKVWCAESFRNGFNDAIVSSIKPGFPNLDDLYRVGEFRLIFEEVMEKDIGDLDTIEFLFLLNQDRYSYEEFEGYLGLNYSEINIYQKEKLSKNEIEICEIWYDTFK